LLSIDQDETDKEDLEVGRIWKNKNSSVIILPQHIAKRYEMDNATNILIIPQKDGALIKKLKLGLP
jgi:hypothetical protein